VKRAAREPHANKLTTIFKRGSEQYECEANITNARGQQVIFYVSTYVNVAGYILTWVATYAKSGKKTTKQLTAFKSRTAAVACARRRAAKLQRHVRRLKAERK
jgi:DNA polymerase III delta subunit